jgi:hypothetical protein
MRKKARKSKKSSVARGRKRDAKGHFVKTRRKRARAREDWRGQPRRHARAARLGHTRRRRRRAARRATVAAPRRRARRVTRRRRASSRRPIVIRVGAPAREAAAETPKPRRRRRRARVREDWRGEPRRHARAARLGWRRRGHTSRRRRAAPRTRTRTVIRTIHKRVGGRPVVINLRMPSGSGRRKSSRRRSRRTPTSHRLPPHMPEAQPGYFGSSGEYTLENPLSAGELAFVVGTAGLGWIAADFLGRYLSTTAVTTPGGATANQVNGIPIGALAANDVVTLIMPGWKNMLGQAVLTVGAGVGAKYAHSPMVKASLQGAMIGVGLHLFADIARPLLANILKNTALGQRLYLAEIEAREAGALTAASTTFTAPSATQQGAFDYGVAQVQGSPVAGTTPGTALAGLPRGVGRQAPQFAAPQPQFRDPGPQAQPRGVGQVMVPVAVSGPFKGYTAPQQSGILSYQAAPASPYTQLAQQNVYQQAQQLAQIAAQQAAAQAAAQQTVIQAYGPGDQLPPAVSVQQQQQQQQIAPPPGFPVMVPSGSACAQASQSANAEIANNLVSGLSGLSSAQLFPDN